jgi:rRNA maturation RNase YbeY
MDYFETKNFSIQRKTKGKLPSLPFVNVKEAILGKSYKLDVALVTADSMDQISLEYKKELGHRNVLGFPYSDKSGEIFMNLQTLRSEAKNFSHSYEQHILFMFIHECLHLKGFKHGKEMENQEDKYMKKFWK